MGLSRKEFFLSSAGLCAAAGGLTRNDFVSAALAKPLNGGEQQSWAKLWAIGLVLVMMIAHSFQWTKKWKTSHSITWFSRCLECPL